MGVPVCRCIVKSHSAKFWVFLALRCYLKIKGPRHLNKRWEIQLILARLSSQGQTHPRKHIDQQKYVYLRMCFLFSPFVSKVRWPESDCYFVLYLFCGSFFLGQYDPQLESSQPFHHHGNLCVVVWVVSFWCLLFFEKFWPSKQIELIQ